MTREMFRGKFGNEWKYGYLTVEPNGLWIKEPYLIGRSNTWHIDPKTVGRYTEMRDTYYEMIHEDDIVQFFGMRGRVEFVKGAFGIYVPRGIKWNELDKKVPFKNTPAFCRNNYFVSLWELFWNFERDGNPLREVEVIGNIYDKAELLEG